MIPWIDLVRSDQIDEISRFSFKNPVVIFKHSTRCSISSMAKMRLESQWDFEDSSLTIYFLDLIKYRSLSNLIAEKFDVHHESPQVIMIQNGVCVYDASHFDISVDELKESLAYLESQT